MWWLEGRVGGGGLRVGVNLWDGFVSQINTVFTDGRK